MGGAEELGRRLTDLKARSGRTYEGLSRRTGISRSTLHRYCSGQTAPDTFGPVEAFALACGAGRSEVVQLFRLWAALDEPDAAAEPLAEPAVPVPGSGPEPVAEPAEPVAGPGPADDPPVRPRRAWLLGLSVPAAVLVLVAGVHVLTGPEAPRAATPQIGQTVVGPAWQDAPRPVDPAFFGVTTSSGTGSMPGFRVGSVRLWDSGTRWSQLEPERGRYEWATLDRLVDGAGRAGLPVLFTIGGTPAWAAPEGTRMATDDGARSAPPDRLEDWDAFVTALSSRYRHRIAAYELWVSAPSPQFWSGSAASLAAMTHRARTVLDRTDPDAAVVCPSMGGLWQEESRRFLTQFAALGGYDDCDAAGVKLQPKEAGGRPEELVELEQLIDRTFTEAGVHPAVWSTGTTFPAGPGQLDDRTARSYAVRLYLLSLYGRYQRTYLGGWGNRGAPIVLQAEGGPPTSAALGVQRLQQWLATARIYACGNGPEDGLARDLWRCRFRIGNGAGVAEAQLVWTATGTARLRVREPALVRTLDDRETSVAAGGSLVVREEPVLVLSPTTPGGVRPQPQ